jgi:hypothetical protein
MNIDPRNLQTNRLVFAPTVEVVEATALTTNFHLALNVVSPELPVPREVYVRFTRDDRRRRVTVTREFHCEKETLGYRDGAQFIPLSICIVDEVIPDGYREVDLAELQVGEQVLVRDDRGELTLVTVVLRTHGKLGGAEEVTLGYYHPTEDGGTKFTPLTKETYVRGRGAK